VRISSSFPRCSKILLENRSRVCVRALRENEMVYENVGAQPYRQSHDCDRRTDRPTELRYECIPCFALAYSLRSCDLSVVSKLRSATTRRHLQDNSSSWVSIAIQLLVRPPPASRMDHPGRQCMCAWQLGDVCTHVFDQRRVVNVSSRTASLIIGSESLNGEFPTRVTGSSTDR